MQAHIPELYIAGVYIHQTDVWVGEFAATSTELINYGMEAELDDLESILVSDMIYAQQVYEDWWNRISLSKPSL
jgi:hypothetical protein